MCRRLDITDVDDDIVTHADYTEAAFAVASLRPIVVALARLGQHNTSKTTASPVCRSALNEGETNIFYFKF